MKSVLVLLSLLISGLLFVQAYGQTPAVPQHMALDHPGIKWNWKIKADDYNFVVTTVSNYDMKNVTLNKDNKELIFEGNSAHDGNIAEIQIPHDLINGNLTVIQNGQQISALIINSGNSSLVVLKFNQTGDITTNIMGTTYLPEFSGMAELVMMTSIVIVMLFTTKMRRI
ncbi:MAG: hypothetical protein ABI340_07540 [Nitrososphaera sp.]